MDKRSLLLFACMSASFLAVNVLFDLYGKKHPAAPVVQQTQMTPAQTVFPQKQALANETLYVLENDYQQLVFSSTGGALAEINLPLATDPQSKSYVKEIAADRTLKATFPMAPYTTGGKEKQTVKQGGYYPLLRRSAPSEHHATAIVSERGDSAQYKATRVEKNLIQFETSIGGTRIVKTYTLDEKLPYCFNLSVLVEGDPSGLWLSTGVPDAEVVANSYTPTLRALSGNEVATLSLPKQNANIEYKPTRWVSNCNGFLGILIHPLNGAVNAYKSVMVEGKALPSRLTQMDSAMHPIDSYPGYAAYLPLQSGQMSYRIFAGPYDNALLAQLDAQASTDYSSSVEIQGWFSFISQPFSQFLSWLMDIFYALTHSWAASIVLLTVALKLMMYPLNSWSIRSTVKMQQLTPRVEAIRERFKKDPKRMQMEIMNLYKEAEYNPLTGCLPMLLQLPFLVGMFYLLKSSVPLRGAVFIPGWIDDLSAPDVLFTWKTHFWIIGNQLHILPILMGLTMYVQQKMTSSLPKDESKLTDAQKQQKMMGPMMAILFTVMFYNFPSGLNIYFMLSTLLGVAQQAWIMNTMKRTKKA